MTIHILKFGVSLCKLPGLPADWPEGHKWISFQDKENIEKGLVNCKICLEMLRKPVEQ